MCTYLTLLFGVKIFVTCFVIFAFLFFKTETVDRLAGMGPSSVTMYRLYGMALLALVVAYAGGMIQTINGEYPSEIVAMGLVSNVGAAGVMLLTGYAQNQKLIAGFFSLIGIGFVCATLFPLVAMLPVGTPA